MNIQLKLMQMKLTKELKKLQKINQVLMTLVQKLKQNKENLVIFDYKATVDGKDFKGSEGKNTQLTLR